jgi:hypothetical protein
MSLMHCLTPAQYLTGSSFVAMLIAMSQNDEEPKRDPEKIALKGVELANAAFEKAKITFDLALAKATKHLEDAEMDVVRAEQYLAQTRIWRERRGEIAAAVRDGATAATIAKTYGLSSARAAQLLYRAQRDNGMPTRYDKGTFRNDMELGSWNDPNDP